MIKDNVNNVFFVSRKEVAMLKQIPAFAPTDENSTPLPIVGMLGRLHGTPVVVSEAIPEPTETTASKLERASQLLEMADYREKIKDLRDLLESPKMSTSRYQNFKQKFSELCQIKNHSKGENTNGNERQNQRGSEGSESEACHQDDDRPHGRSGE